MNQKQKQMLAGGGFQTFYIIDGEGHYQKFHTRADNDAFAAGIELMGATTVITYEASDGAMRQWIIYKDETTSESGPSS